MSLVSVRVARFAGMVVFSLFTTTVAYFNAVEAGRPGLFPWALGFAIVASPLCAVGLRGILRWDESSGSKAPAGAMIGAIGLGLTMNRAFTGSGSVWLLALWASFFIGATGHFGYEWFIRPGRARRETTGSSERSEELGPTQ